MSATEVSSEATISGKLESWQSRLLDLTTRNPLLNFREGGLTLRFPGVVPGVLEDRLALGDKFTVKPLPASSRGLPDWKMKNVFADGLQKKELYCDLDETALDKRFVGIYRKTKSYLQENGTNTLFLAIGFLVWRKPENPAVFRAPLIMLPILLERKTVRAGIRLSELDDEPLFNTTLLEMLRQDFGVVLDGLSGELPKDEAGIDVDGIYAKVGSAVRHLGFEIQEGVVLGHFSFAKYLMWTDLVKSGEELCHNSVVHHLLHSPDKPYSNKEDFVSPVSLDSKYSPTSLYMPFASDASQMAAVATADQGKDFIIIGPPGTGKSQTIGNLIAHLMGCGKRVLFVSEKMAALEVVYRRLIQIGLGDFCLQLHSSKANKQKFVQQLTRARDAAQTCENVDLLADSEMFVWLRDHLNEYMAHLHRKWPNGLTPYMAFGVSMRDSGASRGISLHWDRADIHTKEEFQSMNACVEQIQAFVQMTESMKSLEVPGVCPGEWSAVWENAFINACNELSRHLVQIGMAKSVWMQEMGLSDEECSAADWDALDRVLALQKRWFGLRGQLYPQELSSLPISEIWSLVSEFCEDIRGALRGSAPAEGVAAHGEAVPEGEAEGKDAKGETSPSKMKQNLIRLIQPSVDILSEVESVVENVYEKSQILANSMNLSPGVGPSCCGKVLYLCYQLFCVLQNLDKILYNDKINEGCTDKYISYIKDLISRHYNDRTAGEGNFRKLWDLCSDLMSSEDVFGLKDAVHEISELFSKSREIWEEWNGGYIEMRRTVRSLLESNDHYLSGKSCQAGDQCQNAIAKLYALMDEVSRLAGCPVRELLSAQPNLFYGLNVYIQNILMHRRQLRQWCEWYPLKEKAIAFGLQPLVDLIENDCIRPESIVSAFSGAYCAWFSKAVLDEDEILNSFSAQEQLQKIGDYIQLDEMFRQRISEYIKSVVSRNIIHKIDNDTESWKILRHELEKKTRHLAIRQLFQDCSAEITTLVPCLMMSPLSVAQYLPAKQLFDVVIFDEASQMTAWDAIGSLGRGRQVVVAGDPKQMPPTRFFERSPDEEDVGEELESILDEMRHASIPEIELSVHYRSRRESLIAFSNYTYYNNHLITFPAPVATDSGVKYVYVNGIYERGTTRENLMEARAVVEEIERRLSSLDASVRKQSIGVVTFNMQQQSLIENELDKLRNLRPELEWAFDEEAEEPIFVKNLETVQGDERDVILFSTTFGPDRSGHLTMNFGPLNQKGGERRLNVALTRAKYELVVFSSLRPDQFGNLQTQGPRDLRDFLRYAMTGLRSLGGTGMTTANVGAGFESVVENALLSRGWQVISRLGSSNFRIDLVVLHPTRRSFLAGILCDGRICANAPCAREREIVRPQVLEGLGWNVIRIWVLDWLRDPMRAADALDAQLKRIASGKI